MSLLVLLVTLNNLQAQYKKEQHKVRVKVKTKVNGKETVADSVIISDSEIDVEELIKKLGYDGDLGELHKHKEGDKEIRIEKRVEKRIIKKGEGDEEEIEIDIEMDGESDKDGNVFIFKSDDGDEPIKINIDGDGDNKKVFIMKSEDGKVIEMEGEEDNDIIIIKSGDEVDVKKMIKGGKSKMIWHSDDGEVIEMDGDKVKKKEMIFIQKSGDKDGDISDEEIQKILKEKGIDWESMDKKDMLIKSSSNININISPVNEEDKEALKDMGVDEKAYANDLEVKEMTMKVENDGPVMIQASTEESGHLTAVVRDTTGEVISKTVLKESSNAYKIYLNLEESGTYYVTLSQGGKSLTQKLVIKKA